MLSSPRWRSRGDTQCPSNISDGYLLPLKSDDGVGAGARKPGILLSFQSSSYRLPGDITTSSTSSTSPHCTALILSTATPPLITHFTLSSTTPISEVGSPSTATKSAKYPGATAPSSFALPNKSAALLVAVFNACSGVIPAFTNHPSSRVFCPNMV